MTQRPRLCVVVLFSGVRYALHLGPGDGTFSAPILTPTDDLTAGSGFRVSAMAVGDFSGDGIPDLVASEDVGLGVSNPVVVFLGSGDGTFHLAPGSVATDGTVIGLATADLNGDGKLDVVASVAKYGTVTNLIPSASVAVLLGKGDASFQNPVGYVVDFSPSKPIIRDVDGDARLDIIEMSSSGVEFLKGNGDGTFQLAVKSPVAGFSPSDIALGDINGDGRLDLVAVGLANTDFGSLARMAIMLGNGDGTFGAADMRDVLASKLGPIFLADFNGDGHLDLVTLFTRITQSDPQLAVFFNCAGGCTTESLSAPGQESSYGAHFLVTSTVRGRTSTEVPTGNVSFTDPKTTKVYGSATLSGGTATFDVDGLSVGGHEIVATYAGDANFAPNASPSLLISITPASTTTTVSTSPQSAGAGESVTLTAHVTSSGGVPSGNVIFKDNGASFVTIALDDTGSASYTTSSLSDGSHSIVANFAGSQNFAASTSTATSLVIGSTDFSMTTSAAGNTSATVSAGSPAVYSLMLVPAAGFSGTVSLSCSVAAQGTSCHANPGSIALNGSTASPFTITVNTAPRGKATQHLNARQRWQTGIVFFGMVLLAGFRSRKHRPARLASVVCIAFAIYSVLTLVSCGGGGSSSTPTSGTPAGMYTVVVTATSGNTTHTENLALTVQ